MTDITKPELEVLAQFACNVGYDTEMEVGDKLDAEEAATLFLNSSSLLAPHKDDLRIQQVIRWNFYWGWLGKEDGEVPEEDDDPESLLEEEEDEFNPQPRERGRQTRCDAILAASFTALLPTAFCGSHLVTFSRGRSLEPCLPHWSLAA